LFWTRLISAVVGLLLLALALVLRGDYFYFFVMALSIVAIYEYMHAFNQGGHHPGLSNGIIFTAGAFLLLRFAPLPWALSFVALSLLALFAQYVMDKKMALPDVMITITGYLYPSLILLGIAWAGSQADIRWYIILLTALVIAMGTDTFAYLTGLLIGRHPLAPEISPKKTIEGSVGGTLFAVVLVICAGFLYRRYAGLDIPLVHLVIMGVLGSLAGQIGDLFASKIKRTCGIKDFGQILPGHGGIMDRIDSITFVFIVVASYMAVVL